MKKHDLLILIGLYGGLILLLIFLRNIVIKKVRTRRLYWYRDAILRKSTVNME